jgi:hypothetical protein
MLKTKSGQIIDNIPGEGVPLHVAAERLMRLKEIRLLTGLGNSTTQCIIGAEGSVP